MSSCIISGATFPFTSGITFAFLDSRSPASSAAFLLSYSSLSCSSLSLVRQSGILSSSVASCIFSIFTPNFRNLCSIRFFLSFISSLSFIRSAMWLSSRRISWFNPLKSSRLCSLSVVRYSFRASYFALSLLSRIIGRSFWFISCWIVGFRYSVPGFLNPSMVDHVALKCVELFSGDIQLPPFAKRTTSS